MLINTKYFCNKYFLQMSIEYTYSIRFVEVCLNKINEMC